MSKLIKVAETTSEYTFIWEIADYVLGGYSFYKASRNKSSLGDFLSFVKRHNPNYPIELISQVKKEDAPKQTGLNADIIYFD